MTTAEQIRRATREYQGHPDRLQSDEPFTSVAGLIREPEEVVPLRDAI